MKIFINTFASRGDVQPFIILGKALREKGHTVMIDICKVNESSAVDLSELCSTSFAEAYQGVNSESDIKAYCEKNYSIEKIKANLSNPDIIYMVAHREEKAVGFSMIQNQDCPVTLDGNMVELKQIYVLASEFGSGLGKQLLDAVIQCAHQLNKNWVWLSVSDLNTRAQSFYYKYGFQPIAAAPILEVGSVRLTATMMKHVNKARHADTPHKTSACSRIKLPATRSF